MSMTVRKRQADDFASECNACDKSMVPSRFVLKVGNMNLGLCQWHLRSLIESAQEARKSVRVITSGCGCESEGVETNVHGELSVVNFKSCGRRGHTSDARQVTR